MGQIQTERRKTVNGIRPSPTLKQSLKKAGTRRVRHALRHRIPAQEAGEIGHIYWIPLIPMGKKTRVVKECKACKRGLHLPLAQMEESRAGLRESTDRALAALLAEWEGRSEDAEKAYLQALRLADQSTLPAASLSRIYMSRKDYDAAEAILEQVLAVQEDAVFMHAQLALVRTRKGDADGAAKSYETFFRLAPGTAQDKGLYKDYRKVCKKAGRKALPASDF